MMTPTLRPIQAADHAEALALWEAVFMPGTDYFHRYFAADPWYQDGDCLGAEVDGRLVSAVHVCRRPLHWRGRTVWCGAIANVGTTAEYRRQGLSRALLERAVEHMEATGVDFSMLFTGQHGHYGALAWEQVLTPRPVVTLGPGSASAPLAEETPGQDVSAYAALYESCPAPPLLLQRTVPYYDGWVLWYWRHWKASLFYLPGRGYAAARIPEAEELPLRVIEWRSVDPGAERALLLGMADRARAAGRDKLVFEGAPQFGGLTALRELGEVEEATATPMMLRNVGLPEEEYREIVALYASGEAVWWPSDGF